MNVKKILAFASLLFFIFTATAQDNLVQFSFNKENKGNGIFVLSIKAKPSFGVKVFSIKKVPDDLNTTVIFDSTIQSFLIDSVIEKGKLNTETDSSLNTTINFFSDSVEWQQKIQLNPGDSIRLKGVINYYYKNEDRIQTGEEKISMQFQYENNPPVVNNTNTNDKALSLTALLFAGLLAGLIAFLSPCVYALVPVTVSVFIKKSKTASQGKRNTLFYALSILIIYTLVGVITGPVLSQNAINNLSTNWIFNAILFIMFVIFGLSFLGAFEINLPASWANTLDKKSNSNSYVGIFFMALTLVVVSFSCTGNFVASLLGLSTGSRLAPAIGMFGFGLGLALPFTVFAFFPSLMKNLTKSGGWQNALKVVLGFLELALALKFLSNADIAKGWRILDREIFIVLWVVIFALLGLYLLGKIKFKHDSELPKNDFNLPYVPVSRLMLALTSFAFSIYLIPGLWGAPLNAVSGFVPPIGTQDFILYNNGKTETNPFAKKNPDAPLPPVKYVKRLSLYEPLAAKQNNLTIYYDYDEALAAAKILKKPLMLDFTGINCVNCREFESKIWVNERVMSLMKNDFVVASLFCDYDDEELPDNEKFYSDLLGSKVETVGDKNEDFQQKLIHASGQPNYVFVDNEGKLLVSNGYGYDATKGPQDFVNHLEKVKANFIQ
jgi:cytochrome c biogenesis protein CcdA/thioredoxin-related protein